MVKTRFENRFDFWEKSTWSGVSSGGGCPVVWWCGVGCVWSVCGVCVYGKDRMPHRYIYTRHANPMLLTPLRTMPRLVLMVDARLLNVNTAPGEMVGSKRWVPQKCPWKGVFLGTFGAFPRNFP